jgi:hypothetical protein
LYLFLDKNLHNQKTNGEWGGTEVDRTERKS